MGKKTKDGKHKYFTGEVVQYYPNSNVVWYKYTLVEGLFEGRYILNYSNGNLHKLIDYHHGIKCGKELVLGYHGGVRVDNDWSGREIDEDEDFD